ncbi:hypothetical protein [Actinomadura alba]|uniref:DUF3298 domain-containing protein n=1 Tax=Actinomadura alba TaxID=406431 RepID=A0ABR7LPE5_9ACTN|nr:hypothetical protein [Actinomadura alba]MBC6466631.1 hypothetical protein [Actinomadura alba]
MALQLRQKLQFARVSGLADPAVTEKVNARLRGAAEELLEDLEQDLAEVGDPAAADVTSRTTMMRSHATVGLVNPRMVAVRYRFSVNGADFGAVPARAWSVAILDVTTGDDLTTRDLLAPRVRTAQGASDFQKLLARFSPGRRLCEDAPNGTRGFTAEEITREKGALVSIFPTAKGVEFTLGLAKIGYPMVCGGRTVTIGYTDLKGFLGPALPS